MSISVDQELDVLKKLFISSVAALKETQENNCKRMGGQLFKLKEDLRHNKKMQLSMY